ncbi:MAG: hypothetical protein KatS3mg003_0843 [Candidatus Nitrosocaldaceae archaeon]|nr:MAG: hypothetical protein KatS3mg003_0843 [Candidatus Nitrosocaldaceae archaeon]
MMQSKAEHKLSIPRISKKEQFLKDPDVKRWFDTLAYNSYLNADVMARRLRLFCEKTDILPDDIVRLARKDQIALRNIILDFINRLNLEGKSREYQRGFIKAIKSWLRYWDLDIPKSIKVKNAPSEISNRERVPDEDEYTDVINRADIRARVMIALISKAGLRLQVLGNYNGTDGLRLKDMPDIQVINGKAICKQYPCMIKVRVELSKNRRPYITFLSKQGVKYLLAYLNDRIKNGEVLNEDSPIIAWDNKHRYGYPKHRKSRFIVTSRISAEIRRVIKPYKFRPYVFRSYFDTQLLLAESKGRINRDFRQFFMGHSGDIEHVYTLHKGMLPEYLIKEMRDAYNRCEEYLDLEVSKKDDTEELKTNIINKIASMNKEELLKVMSIFS